LKAFWWLLKAFLNAFYKQPCCSVRPVVFSGFPDRNPALILWIMIWSGQENDTIFSRLIALSISPFGFGDAFLFGESARILVSSVPPVMEPAQILIWLQCTALQGHPCIPNPSHWSLWYSTVFVRAIALTTGSYSSSY
jgi:hypothetical protein